MSLKVIPRQCQICGKLIELNEPVIQLRFTLYGLEPFRMDGFISFCSEQHFIDWYVANKKSLNISED